MNARPEDVASPGAIVTALYEVISGDAGVKRDWDRFRSLFWPGAHMIPVGRDADGAIRPWLLTADGYIERTAHLLETHGFHEIEVDRREDRHGHVAQVWSAYESRMRAPDPEPFATGTNTIQLFNDGARWWVLNVAWTAEIPPEFQSLTKA